MPDPDNTLDLDVQAAHWFAKYRDAKQKIAHYKEIADEAYEELTAIISDREIGRINGAVAFTYFKGSQNRLDMKLLKERYPEIYTECTRAQPTRALKIQES